MCVSVLTYVLNVCECASMHGPLYKHAEVRGGHGLYSSLTLYTLETWSLLGNSMLATLYFDWPMNFEYLSSLLLNTRVAGIHTHA